MRTALHAALFGLAALFAFPAPAALAPNYQRLAELRAVLDNDGVIAVAGTMPPIDRIEYIGPDLYRISAGRCHLDARIVDLPVPPGVVGGRHFAVRPGLRICAR